MKFTNPDHTLYVCRRVAALARQHMLQGLWARGIARFDEQEAAQLGALDIDALAILPNLQSPPVPPPALPRAPQRAFAYRRRITPRGLTADAR